jgi:glycerol kinase
MAYVLALDQGTTSSRAILFDDAARPLSVAQREIAPSYPRPGWVEQEPGEIWSSQAGTATEALHRAGVAPAEVAAVGITNQRETTVLWDRATGTPVHPAIVWQDRRTADHCRQLDEAGLAEPVRARTGLVLDPYFAGTKLRWLLDHVDGAREAAEAGRLAFGTVDSWLIWNLTRGRVHATDATNASRTLLFNIHSGDWDDELLEWLGVPRAVLPEVVPSSGPIADTAGDLLGAEIPITGAAGDQHAALFGQACLEPGMAKNTYGTGSFVLQHTGTEAVDSANHLLTTVAWRIGDTTEYALEGSIFIAGAVVQWLRDGLGIIRRSEDVEELAASVPDTGGVYLVPAFAGLGAPHWDPAARGAIVGLTRGTTAAHIARAALEGIAFQTADVLEAMAADTGTRTPELRVDGGATANGLLMQFQADILGVPVVRPRVTETTALGAAFLAGLGVGVWAGREAVAASWQAEARFEPGPAAGQAAARLADWRRAVERAKDWEQDGSRDA